MRLTVIHCAWSYEACPRSNDVSPVRQMRALGVIQSSRRGRPDEREKKNKQMSPGGQIPISSAIVRSPHHQKSVSDSPPVPPSWLPQAVTSPEEYDLNYRLRNGAVIF